jgi:hypothetical protein
MMTDETRAQLAEINVRLHLVQIAALHAQIEELREEMEGHSSPLEDAAMRLYRADRSRGHLNCSACRFVYADTRDEGNTIAFYTDCSWCGHSGFLALKVTPTELSPYMTGERSL